MEVFGFLPKTSKFAENWKWKAIPTLLNWNLLKVSKYPSSMSTTSSCYYHEHFISLVASAVPFCTGHRTRDSRNSTKRKEEEEKREDPKMKMNGDESKPTNTKDIRVTFCKRDHFRKPQSSRSAGAAQTISDEGFRS
ncbi:hypothetical protein M8J76_014053 [Diaphorina citri]|nr:hypothetical protein M8J76_014053 [Diaphorina citri]